MRNLNWGLIAGVVFSVLVWALVFYIALYQVTA